MVPNRGKRPNPREEADSGVHQAEVTTDTHPVARETEDSTELSQPVYVVSKHTIPTETQDLENLDVQKHHSTVDETSDYVSKSNHTAKSAEEDPLPPAKCAGSDNNSSKTSAEKSSSVLDRTKPVFPRQSPPPSVTTPQPEQISVHPATSTTTSSVSPYKGLPPTVKPFFSLAELWFAGYTHHDTYTTELHKYTTINPVAVIPRQQQQQRQFKAMLPVIKPFVGLVAGPGQ